MTKLTQAIDADLNNDGNVTVNERILWVLAAGAFFGFISLLIIAVHAAIGAWGVISEFANAYWHVGSLLFAVPSVYIIAAVSPNLKFFAAGKNVLKAIGWAIVYLVGAVCVVFVAVPVYVLLLILGVVGLVLVNVVEAALIALVGLVLAFAVWYVGAPLVALQAAFTVTVLALVSWLYAVRKTEATS